MNNQKDDLSYELNLISNELLCLPAHDEGDDKDGVEDEEDDGRGTDKLPNDPDYGVKEPTRAHRVIQIVVQMRKMATKWEKGMKETERGVKQLAKDFAHRKETFQPWRKWENDCGKRSKECVFTVVFLVVLCVVGGLACGLTVAYHPSHVL